MELTAFHTNILHSNYKINIYFSIYQIWSDIFYSLKIFFILAKFDFQCLFFLDFASNFQFARSKIYKDTAENFQYQIYFYFL